MSRMTYLSLLTDAIPGRLKSRDYITITSTRLELVDRTVEGWGGEV